ncbi:unnamed protein product [Pleuronectes platessa]|uniref:Uncharacterized protein n=1 Tax=Pleuronectes platessa TaxID=8262 RepID=A0A9N7TPM0_PLEPL|nr:unnamed protein product [Pleuronectes platessa]
MVWLKMRRGPAILESPMTLIDLIQHDPEWVWVREEQARETEERDEEEEVTRGDRRRRRRRGNDGEPEGGDENVVVGGARWREEGDKVQMMWKMQNRDYLLEERMKKGCFEKKIIQPL